MMNVALAFSPNWAEYVAIEMFALFTTNHCSQEVKVFLMSDELQQSDFDRFDKVCHKFKGCSYQFFNLKETYDSLIPSGINVTDRFTKFTMYRLFLPWLTDVDRLLYIDTDAIVCGDLSELYNQPFGKNLLIGCEDTGLQPNYKTVIGMSEDNPYINAGVCLMDLKGIRHLNLCERWIRTANEIQMLGVDQDVLNTSCEGKIGVVHSKWNTSFSTNLTGSNGEGLRCEIMHWAGGSKPWNNKDCLYYGIWRYWRDKYYGSIS